MKKRFWSFLGYGEKQNNSNMELPSSDFAIVKDKGKEKEEIEVTLNIESNISVENKNNIDDFPEYNSEDFNSSADNETSEEGVGSSTQLSGNTEDNLQIVPYPNISTMPSVSYTNTAMNFLTNMNNGSGAHLLTNGVKDLSTGVGHFGDAGKGFTNVILNVPALATQALTISKTASYLVFAADNAWLVGATLGQIPYAGSAIMGTVQIASTLMLVHPVLVTGVVGLAVVGIYQQPIKNVCGGIKDTVVEGALGNFYVAKGAAELLGMPIGSVKDIFSNIGSTQNSTKSATEAVKIDLSDIEILTPEQITEKLKEITDDFVIIGEAEDKESETVNEEVANGQNDQDLTNSWYAILGEDDNDNLAQEIAANRNDEQDHKIMNEFTSIKLFEQIVVDSGDQLTMTGLNEMISVNKVDQ